MSISRIIKNRVMDLKKELELSSASDAVHHLFTESEAKTLLEAENKRLKKEVKDLKEALEIQEELEGIEPEEDPMVTVVKKGGQGK